jgi:hypothetical protein
VTPAVNTQRSPRTRPTHCPQGHEYNEINCSVGPTGVRQCRVCKRERYRAKTKENLELSDV